MSVSCGITSTSPSTSPETYHSWAITANIFVDEHAVNDLALTVYAKTRGIVGTIARFSPCVEIHALFIKLVEVSLEEISRLGFLGCPTSFSGCALVHANNIGSGREGSEVPLLVVGQTPDDFIALAVLVQVSHITLLLEDCYVKF